jgi:hypothetical protein
MHASVKQLLTFAFICTAAHPWTLHKGYVLTRDIATLFAHPPLPLMPQTVEDRRMGVVLFGFNVTYKDAMRFHPWGHCEPNAMVVYVYSTLQ